MKTFLAIVAALCAFLAVATSAAPEAQKLDSPNENDLIHKIEESVAKVLSYLEESNSKWQEVVRNTGATLQDAAYSACTNWNHTVWTLALQADEAGIDVSDCTDAEEQPLQDLIDKFTAEANECMLPTQLVIERALNANTKVFVDARGLLEEAKTKVEECRRQGNPLVVGFCLAKNLVPIQVKAAALVAQSAYLDLAISSATAGISDAAESCASSAALNKKDQALVIVGQAELCIRSKLPNTA